MTNPAHNWCFTINNYDDTDIIDVSKWPARYTIYGKEKGENGTPHLQGFTVLQKQARLGGVKKLHGKAHWEQAKGTWEQNVEYCSKQGDVTEIGERPATRKRTGS